MLLPPQAILGHLSKHVTLIMMIFSRAPTAEFILNLGADRPDQKLDPRNRPGVFLGYATLKQTYGAVLLSGNALVSARSNVAFDENLMPYHQKQHANNRMELLRELIHHNTSSSRARCVPQEMELGSSGITAHGSPTLNDPPEDSVDNLDPSTEEDSSDDDSATETALQFNTSTTPPFITFMRLLMN
jgi:hypothetical protein